MKKIAFAATLAVVFTANVQADTVGLYIGGQAWQSEASGTLGEKNSLINPNLKKEQQINYSIAFEHPIPLIPNTRIASTTLDTTGNKTLAQALTFGGESFSIGDDIKATFNVSYIDYTLYYELLDNDAFSFDLGLTARDFNGDVTVTGPTSNSDGTCNDPNPSPDSPCTEEGESTTPIGKIKADEIEPMLYVATNIGLPLASLSIFGQGDISIKGEHSLYDYQVGLNYDLVNSRVVDLNLTLGYRVVKMEFEDLNNLYTNLEFKGAFVGIVTHF